jgi:nitroreductase
MKFLELVKTSRSCRRFMEDRRISSDILTELIKMARFTPSSGNIQSLKFYLSATPQINATIFSTARWAAYYKDWKGPEEGERPSAYIIILSDTEIHSTIEVDVGIAAQTIMLGAASMGIAGCMIGSFNRRNLQRELKIDSKFEIPLLLALGYPAEKAVLEDMVEDDIRYWRDQEGNHHVPKRTLEELIINYEQQ